MNVKETVTLYSCDNVSERLPNEHALCSGPRGRFGHEQVRYRARTVHESVRLSSLGLALERKQIPQIVENIGKHDTRWNSWKEFFCLQSRRTVWNLRRPDEPSVNHGHGGAPASLAGALSFDFGSARRCLSEESNLSNSR
jgi:hypothetical protein